MKVVEEDITRNCSRDDLDLTAGNVFSNSAVDNWNSLSIIVSILVLKININTFKMHVSSELKSGAVKF